MMMATRFPKMIVGQRRPRRGPSEIQTARSEYTAVKALLIVGYSFLSREQFCQCITRLINRDLETYYLGNGIDEWFACLVVRFQPENERCGRLASKGLHCFGH
jgi:hypothetical protein